MKLYFLPKTRPGWWSAILTGAAFLPAAFFNMLPPNEGYSGIEYLRRNPLLAIGAALSLLCSAAACIVGLVAIFKRKDHSILVILCIAYIILSVIAAIGLLLFIYMIARAFTV